MANNYTNFSIMIKLKDTEKARSWIETLLAKTDELAGDDTDDEEILEAFPRWADYQCTGFEWSIVPITSPKTPIGTGLWIRDSGGEGNTEAVATFVQAYLKRFDPNGKVGFQYADTCSSQRVDEFGGGACIVTAKKQKWLNTFDWMNKEMSK
jgi:hypothetical protein